MRVTEDRARSIPGTTSVTRGHPFGAKAWAKRTADALGPTHTLRDAGRPSGV